MTSDDYCDDVPWAQIGPTPTHLWAWHDPAFHAQVRPGMILETNDCAYILVKEIRPDGIIQGNVAPGLGSGEFLWTWDALARWQCLIYPSSDADEPTR
ncbi:MAG TPA: hypothetical protein VFK13_15590 [Gemmatimonadaceae bacterium]|nr:hypothetical protein [Gemmatimonadaceae bacterium]